MSFFIHCLVYTALHIISCEGSVTHVLITPARSLYKRLRIFATRKNTSDKLKYIHFTTKNKFIKVTFHIDIVKWKRYRENNRAGTLASL